MIFRIASWCCCWPTAVCGSGKRCRCAAGTSTSRAGRLTVAHSVAQLPGGPVIDTPRTTSGRQQRCHGFRRRFIVAVRSVGLADVTPHDLRATHARWVADSGGVLVAAHRLGHPNASVTTRHYARAVDGRDAEVAQHLDASRSMVARRSGAQRA